MEGTRWLYEKQKGSAEAGGHFCEIKLAMLFLLRGMVAYNNGEIDGFRLATNVQVAHPFDDVVFLYFRGDSSEIILLQAKHKKEPSKELITWKRLMSYSSKGDFSVKSYLNGSLEMNLDKEEMLNGHLHQRYFILYTNAPLAELDEVTFNQCEPNAFIQFDDKKNSKINYNNRVYHLLKEPTDFTSLVDALIESAKSLVFKPEIPIFRRYENHLKEFVVGFEMNKRDKDLPLFANYFLDGSAKIPGEILELRNAIFLKMKSSCDSDEELIERLKQIRVEVAKGYAGTQKVEAKSTLNTIVSEKDVRSFLNDFYIGFNQPSEVDLEIEIQKEIKSFYKITKEEAMRIYCEVYCKTQAWWKDERYFLSESNDWFETSRKNQLNPTIKYAIELFETKLKHTGLVFKNVDELQRMLSLNRINNVVCNEANILLNASQIWQALLKFYSNKNYIFLEHDDFHRTYEKILIEFNGDCDILAVISNNSIPSELITIIEKSNNKQLIWVGAEVKLLPHITTSISLDCRFENLASEVQNEIFKNAQVNLQGNIIFLSELIEFSLANEIITEDILADLVNEKVLKVGQTITDMGKENSYLIPQKLQRDMVGNEIDFYPDDIKPDAKNKFILISGVPGMGKSTMLTSLASKRFNWKYRINLIEYSEILMNFNTNISTLNFLKDACHMTELEFQLFKISYEKYGNIVLFFDGFDEIAPDYKSSTLEILLSLNKSMVDEIWVTTRPGFKDELERKLDTAAFTLLPLSKDDQRKYLKNIWNMDNHRFVDKFLKKFQTAINDRQGDFMGVPLHLKMIAEIGEKAMSFKEWNLFKIYDSFFKNKYFQVLIQSKGKVDLSNLATRKTFERDYNAVQAEHEKLAMFTLFEKRDLLQVFSPLEIHQIENLIRTEIEKGTEKSGLVYAIINRKPVFVHRTYAEFFAASWLVKNFLENDLVNDFKTLKIYRNIYIKDNLILRTFFDFALCKDTEVCRAVLVKDQNTIWKMSPGMVQELDLAGRNAMHLAFAYQNEEIIQILTKRGVSKAVVDRIFKYTPAQYETLLYFIEEVRQHYYYRYEQTSVNSIYWESAQGNLKGVKKFIEMGCDVNAPDKDFLTPLHLATSYGHIGIVQHLIKLGAIINVKDKDGLTPLHAAAIHGQYDTVKFLLEKGADINEKNLQKYTPLHSSIINEHRDIVECLIENGANVNTKDHEFCTPLHLAIGIGDYSIAKRLIDNGADVNVEVKSGFVPLQVAIQYGRDDISMLLIQKGAHVNLIEENGNIPLISAGRLGQEQVLKYLLDNGANPKAKQKNGWTALHAVSDAGYLVMVKDLIEAGAEVNAKDEYGCTALHVAVDHMHWLVAELLIRSGADVNVAENRNWRPLHLAAQYGSISLTLLLITNGADVNAKGLNDVTPIHMAIRCDETFLVDFLIKEKADIHAKDYYGNSCLHFAAQYGCLSTATLLIAAGADLNLKEDKFMTPLHVAAQNGHCDVVKLFIESGAKSDIDVNGTPLHLASQRGHYEVARVLVTNGANVNSVSFGMNVNKLSVYKNGHINNEEYIFSPVEYSAKNVSEFSVISKYKWTPLHLAAQNGHHNIVKYLVESGADVNGAGEFLNPFELVMQNGRIIPKYLKESVVRIKCAWTPLHLAAHRGFYDVVKYLVECKADVNARSESGCTPLMLAIQCDRHDVSKYLMDNGGF